MDVYVSPYIFLDFTYCSTPAVGPARKSASSVTSGTAKPLSAVPDAESSESGEAGYFWKTIGKLWETHRKTIGKP